MTRIRNSWPKIKLPKGSRTMTGELMADKYGGDILDDFKKWMRQENEHYPNSFTKALEKLSDIEKEYGVTYVE